jgi:hypothetical protein
MKIIAKLFFYIYNTGVIFQRKMILKTILKIIEVGYSTEEVIKMFFDKKKNNNLRILIFAQFL